MPGLFPRTSIKPTRGNSATSSSDSSPVPAPHRLANPAKSVVEGYADESSVRPSGSNAGTLWKLADPYFRFRKAAKCDFWADAGRRAIFHMRMARKIHSRRALGGRFSPLRLLVVPPHSAPYGSTDRDCPRQHQRSWLNVEGKAVSTSERWRRLDRFGRDRREIHQWTTDTKTGFSPPVEINVNSLIRQQPIRLQPDLLVSIKQSKVQPLRWADPYAAELQARFRRPVHTALRKAAALSPSVFRAGKSFRSRPSCRSFFAKPRRDHGSTS